MKKQIQPEFYVETNSDIEIKRENVNELLKEYINHEMTDEEWIWFEKKGLEEIFLNYQEEIQNHSSDITDNLIHDFLRNYFVQHLNKENKNEK